MGGKGKRRGTGRSVRTPRPKARAAKGARRAASGASRAAPTRRSQESSEELLRSVFENPAAGVALLDTDGAFLRVNQTLCQMVGYSAEELTRLTFRDLTPEADRHIGEDFIAQALAGHAQRADFTKRYLHRDGHIVWVHISTTLTRGAGGRPLFISYTQDITERRKAEESLRASEARFRAVIEQAPEAISMARDGLIIYVNRKFMEIYGSSDRTAVIGRPLIEFWAPQSRPILEERFRRRTLGLPLTPEFEGVALRSDGSSFPLHAAVADVDLPDGRAQIAFLSDISERALGEEKVRRSEARLRSFFELPLLGFAITSPQKGWLAVNDRLCEMLGYRREELLATNWAGLTHPDDLAANMVQFSRLLDGEIDSYSLEKRYLRRDGEVIWASIASGCVRKSDGSVDYLCTLLQETTQRKKAELRVHQLNRMYAMVSDVNGMMMREKDPQRIFAAACRIAVEKGKFRGAWIGLPDPSGRWLRPAAAAGVLDGYLEHVNIDLRDPVLSGGPAGRCYLSGQCAICNDIATDPRFEPWRREALKRGYRSSGVAALKVDGKVVGIINLYGAEPDVFDIEELALVEELAGNIGLALEVNHREVARQAAEAGLHESEERFRQLAENMNQVFWMTDLSKGQMLYISPAYEKVWGRSLESLRASPLTWVEAIHGEDRERVRQAALTHQALGTYDETFRVVRPDGSVRWVRDRAFPVRNAEGVVVRIVGTVEDITARLQLEEQLRQSQKMEGIGQLAGGVAHDFNNILAAMMMQTELVEMMPGLPQPAYEKLRQLRGFAERAANLTRQLLLFSRRQVMQPRDLDLNDAIVGTARMLQRIIGEHVQLKLNLHPRALLTHADPGMLDQVLMNLVVNARDAMPGGGTLVVETAEQTFTAADAGRHQGLGAGRYVCLKVSDTGSGIAPDHLLRIFEPFFTTKEPGKGTGLGLATVFGVVRQHGGAVSVQSTLGRGSTFEILLPAIAHAVPEPAAAAGALPRGTETVLLVEDEPIVCDAITITLERAGYRVLKAGNGPQALELWDQHRDEIRLLLTDLVMPQGMSGRELAARLRTSDAALRVVFMSGYSAEMAGREISLQAGQDFIQKPYSSQQLLEIVRQALDRYRSPGAAAAPPAAVSEPR
jgi:two-component system, cell cycle sensor histidine kinase and response regulator CckA